VDNAPRTTRDDDGTIDARNDGGNARREVRPHNNGRPAAARSPPPTARPRMARSHAWRCLRTWRRAALQAPQWRHRPTARAATHRHRRDHGSPATGLPTCRGGP